MTAAAATSMHPPTATKVSNLASSSSSSSSSSRYEEAAATPTISNRASPKQVPPPLNLDGAHAPPFPKNLVSYSMPQHFEHSLSSWDNSLLSRGARFSSESGELIEMQRPLLEETPVSLSPSVVTAAPPLKNGSGLSPMALSRTMPAIPGTKPLPRSLSTTASKEPMKLQRDSLAWSIPDIMPTTTSSDGEGDLWMSLLLHVMPYSLACDIVKTGVPWTLLRNIVLNIWQKIISGTLSTRSRLRIHAPLLSPQSTRAAAPARGTGGPSSPTGRDSSTSLLGSSPFSNAPSSRQGVIQGIPNFGQTCFMNSVLQSLASLEPFLAYLERIHRVQQDSYNLGTAAAASASHSFLSPSSPQQKQDFFAQQVLDLLMAVNGMEVVSSSSSPSSSLAGSARNFVSRIPRGNHNRLRIDPRPLLRHIGETHAQFEQKHMGEQQDSQEWLQALLAVVITEAQLDSITAASDHMRFENVYSTSVGSVAGEEVPMTVVIAGFEGTGREQPHQQKSMLSSVSSSTSSSDGEPDAALPLSSLLERIDEGRRSVQLQNRSSVDPVTSSSSSATMESSSQDTGEPPFPEEKKQEDFEVSVPFVASEQSLEELAKEPPPSHVIQVPPKNQSLSNSALSDTTWGDESRASDASNQSMAMKIVKSTISSITPSPLSGWLGSTIQCCNCQHIRPIRNSPFLDIPLVPTSVPAFLGGINKYGPNVSPLPACTIEQCLADFTSVERVSDVECRYCTIQAEIRELQEEEMLLSGAIESTEKRIRAKGGDPVRETKTLQEELNHIQLRLVKLRTMDPDEEDLNLLDTMSHDEGTLLLDESSHLGSSARLARCDARKCLFLTRCPSILCCHIQRRYYDPYTNRMEKCVQHLLFDEILNLAPYCAYSPQASTSWVAGSSRSGHPNRKHQLPMLYRLQSVIEHRGNAHGGHYVCYRRFGSSWYRISDNTVTPISWKQVRNCQAYMLFYEAM